MKLDKGDLIVLQYGTTRLYYGDSNYMCFDTKNDYCWTRISVSGAELARAFTIDREYNPESVIIR